MYINLSHNRGGSAGYVSVQIVDCFVVLVLVQTKATYEPLGAASEGKRAASPWSPPEQRGLLWGHVYAPTTG